MPRDLCDLISDLRPFFFPKDRDIYLIDGRVFIGQGSVPIGGIIIWSGAIGAIPTGWAICDGNNSTPDLRNLFVIGAGDTYAVGATGGSATQDLEHTHADGSYAAANDTHNHGVTGTSGGESSHTHAPGTLATGDPTSTEIVQSGSGDTVATAGHHHDTTAGGAEAWTGATAAGSNHSHSDGTYAAANDTHSHDVTGTSATGGSAAQSVLNPYYALAFIMRTA